MGGGFTEIAQPGRQQTDGHHGDGQGRGGHGLTQGHRRQTHVAQGIEAAVLRGVIASRPKKARLTSNRK